MSHDIHCLNCSRTEMEIPLLELRFSGSRAWICSQCLPLLIHKPQQLAGKLTGAGDIWAAPPDEH